MIPGLEYEQPPNGNADPSYGSPSGQSHASMSSVDIHSPQNTPAYNANDSYHMQQLHRRRPHSGAGSGYNNGSSNGGGSSYEDKYAKRSRVVKKLDIFPKTDREMTVRTERGGQLTAVGYVIMAILILAEFSTWRGMNSESLEHILVDTR